MTYRHLLTALPAIAGFLLSHASEADSLKVVDIETITVVAQPKTHIPLKQQPLASTLIGPEMLKEHNVQSIKGLSGLTPNLFIPNYGSSLTSAMYIRGIGSRINSPAVGLYVDNIPYTDKSAFDFMFTNVERIDVLRGPQGTLYGRNTMGGLVMVHTKDPLRSQGMEFTIGGATADMSYYANINYRIRFGERTGFSFAFSGREARGIHRNRVIDQWAEHGEKQSISFRLVHQASETLKMDFTLGSEHNDERQYPYQFNGSLNEDGGRYDSLIGRINNNRPHGYERDMLNVGAHLQWTQPRFTLNSTTGYQWVDDDMRIDQDFLPDDIFTLQQKQDIHTLNQEFILKSRGTQRWKWVTGVSGTLQWNRTNAPVNFYTDGVKMIQGFMDEGMKNSPMKMLITDEQITVSGRFRTPVRGAALFHQSDVNIGQFLTLSMGLRLDHEWQEVVYDSRTALHAQMKNPMTGMPMGQMMEMPVEYIGDLHKDQTHLLPRAALTMKTGVGNVYASFSKGMRSGGYNIQMFNEIMQNSFNPTARPEEGKESEYIRQQTSYAPEWSLNYEVGTHLKLFNGMLCADASIFLINTHDQQVSRFTDNGLGRILVNAGRTRSWGSEFALTAQPTACLSLNAGYGYTHATFTSYDSGISDTDERTDYTGNRVPFAPEHTINAGVRYDIDLTTRPLGIQRITLRTDYQGAGRIWWTEDNTIGQPYYSQLHAGVTLNFRRVEVDFYGRNLTNKRFDTFRFHSMERDFSQVGCPRDFQARVTWRL